MNLTDEADLGVRLVLLLEQPAAPLAGVLLGALLDGEPAVAHHVLADAVPVVVLRHSDQIRGRQLLLLVATMQYKTVQNHSRFQDYAKTVNTVFFSQTRNISHYQSYCSR